MPLTDAQKYKHWSMAEGWGAVCRVNAWRLVKGRMDSAARRVADGGWHQSVWVFANVFALENNRAVTPDDLRKGTYTLAIGKPKSLTKFDNADLDRVLLVFKLLIEPNDLRAVKSWLAFEAFDRARAEIERCRRAGVPCTVSLPDDPGEMRRHLFFVTQYDEALIRDLAKDRFGGVLPEDMPLKDLRQFTMTLKNRRDYRDKPVCTAEARRSGGVSTQPMQEVEEPF